MLDYEHGTGKSSPGACRTDALEQKETRMTHPCGTGSWYYPQPRFHPVRTKCLELFRAYAERRHVVTNLYIYDALTVDNKPSSATLISSFKSKTWSSAG